MGKRIIGLTTAYYDANEPTRRTNRTGAALLLGGVYQVDLIGTDTTSQTSSATDPDKAQGQVLKVTTAGIACGCLIVSRGTAADDLDEQFVEGELVECMALVDGTTDIAAGDGLKAENASTAFVKATLGTDRFHAIAQQAYTSATPGLCRVLLISSGRK